MEHEQSNTYSLSNMIISARVVLFVCSTFQEKILVKIFRQYYAPMKK